MEKDDAFWIKHLQLSAHPEGGFYKETYRAETILSKHTLAPGFGGDRPVSTAIYFLLQQGDFSAFHRIASDELWHFYSGGMLEIFEIESDGNLLTHLLGNDADKSQFQVIVKAGHWFASRPVQGTAYSLVGCTVAPGFHYDDFEMASGKKLKAEFPQHSALIESLTR